MNPAWWTRLYDSVANVFRRCPPHLRGRVPVDCGVGKADTYAHSWHGQIVIWDVWSEEPDAAGRAFLMSAPPLAPEVEAKRKTEELREALTKEASARVFVPLPQYPTVFEYEAHKAVQQQRETAQEVLAQHVGFYGPPATLFNIRTADGHTLMELCAAGMVLNRPDMQVVIRQDRPSPADNARRYSQEESTW